MDGGRTEKSNRGFTMKQYKHAFVIGRFLPPHIGHLSMINFANQFAEHTTLLVEQEHNEAICVDDRVHWLKHSVHENEVSVLPLYGTHPASPPSDPHEAAQFWLYWKNLIAQYAPQTDVLISSDDYGQRLAQDQNVPWLPFDRKTFPISATIVKEKPWDRYQWLVPAAQQSLLRRLVVVGAESTGKSVLCENLARTGNPSTVFVPEYAEHWIRRQPEQPWDADTLLTFLNGQTASRNGLRAVANRWMCEDSHALTTAVWAEYLGHHDLAEYAYQCAQRDRPHHVIVCSTEGAVWSKDVHRPDQSDMAFFEHKFIEKLDEWGWDYSVVSGDWDTRTTQAVAVRERFLYRWQTAHWADWAGTSITQRRMGVQK